MEEFNMNALIFHQVDLLDQLTLPRAYFSEDHMWGKNPVRLHQVENNQQFIRNVVREAKKRNIDFYIEIKEIGFPDELLELHPELMKENGAICATDEFWWRFLRDKVDELLEEIPDIAGIIVSPASRESKVSIVANACTCEQCKNYLPSDWYKNLFKAMYEPLQAKNKQLVVRDFAYTAAQQNVAIDAAASVSKNIVVAMKNTPPMIFTPPSPTTQGLAPCPTSKHGLNLTHGGSFLGWGFSLAVWLMTCKNVWPIAIQKMWLGYVQD